MCVVSSSSTTAGFGQKRFVGNLSGVNPIPGAALPTSGILSWHFKRSPTHTHQGIDIPKPKGTPVLAAASGVVTHASSVLAPGFSGYGRIVVVRQSPTGPWFLYAHLDQVLVSAGQQVQEGQKIATVGDSCFSKDAPGGDCSGSHLHFEVSPKSYPQDSEATRLDPVAWIEGRTGSGVAVLLLVAAGVGYWFWRRRR